MIVPADIFAELQARYAEPHRAYHDWTHIEHMLELAEEVRSEISDWDAFTAAILFHDAIYDPRSSDNERRSADLMITQMTGKLSPDALRRIEALIMATAGHVLPEGDDDLRKDAALFLDIDLSILGASPEKFAVYDTAIRTEYRHVPEDAYRQGRRAVLKTFLDRDRLYLTDVFSARFDTQARINLAAAIA
jgi:predicted metal-dependent HD superfamily phosphohydrolase